MSREWENTNYEKSRRRIRLMFVSLLLSASIMFVLWLLHRAPPGDVRVLAANQSHGRAVSVFTAISPVTVKPAEEIAANVGPESMVAAGYLNVDAGGARQEADALFAAGKFSEALKAYNSLASADSFSRGRAGLCLAQLGRWDEAVSGLQEAVSTNPNDFVTRKWLAQAFYRQNELELALEQIKSALALQADAEVLEMQAKLEKEIRVQRNYDHARTANFVVMFDGYEHDELKHIVLDILKSAYAEIGKNLNYFPEQPISVILYAAKDFSDVTSAPLWVGGMFGKLDGKIRVPVQGAVGNEPALRRVLYHEYTHALLYAMAADCPLWLQEGLAQYFSGDKPVNIGQVIPLSLLSKGFPSEARAAFTAYMECLQLVNDLIEEYGLSRLCSLLDKMSAGNDLDAAFAIVYGQPFSRWALHWRPQQPEE